MTRDTHKHVTVLGAGAWGTAFATLLASNGHEVTLWCFEPEVARDIAQHRENKRYLPGVALAENIKSTSSLGDALSAATIVFEVIPVKFLRTVLQQAKQFVSSHHIWVVLSKGIEQETLLLPSAIIDDVFGTHTRKATLGGPNFAKEFAERAPTATTLAADDCDLGRMLQKLLANDYFRPYLSLDVSGVQIGGAIKNVLTLIIGIARGAGCKDNTVAFLLTRGLVEMVQLAQLYGGKAETIYGLSGLGDLVLTSMGDQGRNLKVGMMLGQRQSLDDILKTTGLIPEGVNTVQSVWQIIQKHHLNLPICKGTYEIIFEGRGLGSLLEELMARPLVEECALET